MKKSNIILLSFFGFISLLAFAVHAALNAQYKKGIFVYRNNSNQKQFDTLNLDSFSKVVFRGQRSDTRENRSCDLNITYDSAGSNQLLVSKPHSSGLIYKVHNDTLYIVISDPKENIECRLLCTRLNYIVTNSNTDIEQRSALDKLDIRSSSYLHMSNLNARQINMLLNDNGFCEIDEGGRVDQFSIEMRGASTFDATNCSLNFNRTKFGEGSTLILSGKSLQSFTRP